MDKKETELTSMEAAAMLVAHGFFKAKFPAYDALMAATRKNKLPSRHAAGNGRTPRYFEKEAVLTWAQNRRPRR